MQRQRGHGPRVGETPRYAEGDEHLRVVVALALSQMSFLGPASRLRVSRRLTADRLRVMSAADVGDLGSRAPSDATSRRLERGSYYLAASERAAESLTRLGVGCIFLWQPGYPRWLREVHDPPLVLYYRGRKPDPGTPKVAVVGTRSPTGLGRERAFRLGYDLVQAGVPVISGLARGIDIAAHRGAVAAASAGRCMTIGVLGCGIDQIYPKSSRELGRKMLEQGCIVSEYPPGVPPLRYHFPMRNRIIAGLSVATVIVEAPRRSGALITADCAIAEGREVMVHGDVLGSGRSAGCLQLYEQGAAAVAGVDELRHHAGAALAGVRSNDTGSEGPPALDPADWRGAGAWLVAGLRAERMASVATTRH